MRPFLPAALLSLASMHCSVEPVDLEGKACPCGSGFRCVDGRCTQRAVSPGDAGGQDADAAGEAGADAVVACAAPKAPKVPRLAAGTRHTCVIRGGELWCWGRNDVGQLGVGDLVTRSLPTRVGGESDWITVAAAGGHTCGIRSTSPVGSLYCWGSNEFGQLGIGAGDAVVSEPALVSHNIQFRLVTAGESHTCALAEDRLLWCWGRQAGGAVGLGNLGDPMTSPARVSQIDAFLDLSAGTGHNCAVRDDASLWCWGHFECFQLGSPSHHIVPHQVDDQCWRGVATGATHTCAILEDGSMRCFGENNQGQLGFGVIGGGEAGFGDCVGYVEPQPVAGNHTWAVARGGRIHTCGITTGGELYCWGYNEQKQIADVAEKAIPTPTQLGTDGNWDEVAAGFFHTCARNTQDEVYCRGLNEDGQQGTGSFNRELKLVTF